MNKIKILSIEQLKESFSSFGISAAAEAKHILVLSKDLIQESLKDLKFKDTLTIIKLHGFTVKFDTVLLPKIQSANEVEISLFESTIDNKPIKWARITAAV